MWENFKTMPMLLKFLTAHAIACIAFLFGSVIPHDSFSVNGQSVTYSEWWSSGIGIYVSILGALMAIAGYLLVSKKRFSRQIYLAVVPLGLVVPYLKFGEYTLAVVGVVITLGIAAYLFLKASAKEYFASNNRMQSDAAKLRR